jgi:hypothetical protein
VTAPRWIAAAMDDELFELDDSERADFARSLIERLPINEMARAMADAEANRADQLVSIVRVLSDGDPEVVELTELCQAASKALDDAGVPYAAAYADDGDQQVMQLNLAGRIRWLAQQRPTKLALEGAVASCEEYRQALMVTGNKLKRVEAERESFRADVIHVRAIAEVIGQRDATIKSLTAERDEAQRMLGLARAAVATELLRCADLTAERDRLAEECEAVIKRAAGYIKRISELERGQR